MASTQSRKWNLTINNPEEAGLNREEQTHANQQKDQNVVGQIGIDCCYDVENCLLHFSLPPK